MLALPQMLVISWGFYLNVEAQNAFEMEKEFSKAVGRLMQGGREREGDNPCEQP